jgi:hypothetical protein
MQYNIKKIIFHRKRTFAKRGLRQRFYQQLKLQILVDFV